jgi:two-component system response regulator WspF
MPTVVAIGASTGGPEALARTLTGLPADFPAAIVIIQHVAVEFAPSLARWLQGQSLLPVRVAQDGDALKPGEVLLAGTDDHLILRLDRCVAYTADPADYPYRPSVDVFFNSLAATGTRPGVAVLLTGMGRDGAQGLLHLRRLGWHTITQDQASCVVYGMPRAAADLQAACQVLPLTQIPEVVVDRVRKLAQSRGGAGQGREGLSSRGRSP